MVSTRRPIHFVWYDCRDCELKIRQRDQHLRVCENSLQMQFHSPLDFRQVLFGNQNLAILGAKIQIPIRTDDVDPVNLFEPLRDTIFLHTDRNGPIGLDDSEFAGVNDGVSRAQVVDGFDQQDIGDFETIIPANWFLQLTRNIAGCGHLTHGRFLIPGIRSTAVVPATGRNKTCV